MIKILQTGTYNSMNKGDAAMQISMADSLSRIFPESRIMISSPFPEIDRFFYKDYEVIICSRRRLIWASFQLLRAAFWRFFKHFGANFKWLIPETELQEYLHSDLIVDLSGDMLTEDYGPHVAYSHFIPLLLAIILQRRFAICAQSIGPFKLTKLLARIILKRAAFITTRDQISFDYLSRLRLHPERVSKTADLAFLLDPISRKNALSLLKVEGINPIPGRPLLGVSLSHLVKSKYDKNNPHSDTVHFEDLFASILDDLSIRYGLDILFIPHVTGPSKNKDDRNIHLSISTRMKTNFHLLNIDYAASELKGIIGLCEMMIGARMHANIAALSNHIPTMAVAYSHKSLGIMQMLGQGYFVLDISSLSKQEITNKFANLHVNRHGITSMLKKTMGSIKSLSMENVNLIKTLLMENG